jgi:hypothetical protein
MSDPELEQTIADAMRAWRDALGVGVERMRVAGLVDASTDPGRVATSILAAIQGGLVLSQPERSAWPLEVALDGALAPLHGVALGRPR